MDSKFTGWNSRRIYSAKSLKSAVTGWNSILKFFTIIPFSFPFLFFILITATLRCSSRERGWKSIRKWNEEFSIKMEVEKTDLFRSSRRYRQSIFPPPRTRRNFNSWCNFVKTRPETFLSTLEINEDIGKRSWPPAWINIPVHYRSRDFAFRPQILLFRWIFFFLGDFFYF